MITEYQQVVPTEHRCIAYLMWMESAFDVSLKFWLSVEISPGRYSPIQLYMAGSGLPFDLMADREGLVKAPILRADHGSIYPAMWACLTIMEHTLASLGSPRTARPPM